MKKMKIVRALNVCTLVYVGILAACQSKPPAPVEANSLTDRPAAVSSTAGFQWGYDITGDRAIRPIQVFSNGEKTWLQMSPSAAFPAIFVNDQPVPFSIETPYLVIVGAPQRINLVSTQYRAIVSRRVLETKQTTPARSAADTSRIQTVPSNQIPKE